MTTEQNTNKTEMEYESILDVLRERRQSDIYDSEYDVGGVCWILPESDMDSQSALVWMLAERIHVDKVSEDRCTARISDFVREHYVFIRKLNNQGWTPLMTGDMDDDENICTGIEMIEALVTGNAVQIDALKMLAYLDPFIDNSVRILSEGEE